jgi:hypothetical protein
VNSPRVILRHGGDWRIARDGGDFSPTFGDGEGKLQGFSSAATQQNGGGGSFSSTSLG